MTAETVIACPQCDVLQRPTPVAPGGVARCPRCNAVIYRGHTENLDLPLAFTLAALIFFAFANVFPIAGLELQGRSTEATLFGMVRELWEDRMEMLAVLVFFTTIFVPTLELAAMCYVLGPLRFGRVPQAMPFVLRLVHAIRPWDMVEVFMLGVLVSLVKLEHVANVIPGLALWSFGGLMMMIAAAEASFDPRSLWAKLELAR